MQVILDSSFARPGSAPIWGGKKGEFRDWTSSHWMPNSYGFYRKAEDVEVRFYGIVNAHIASEMI